MSFKDPHSYSRPSEVVVTHLDLELDVDFEARVLEGVAVLSLDSHADAVTEVVLDTWQLEIDAVEVDGAVVEFTLGPEDPLLGRSLSVPVTAGSKALTVRYRTSPEARALQWLEPQQTLGGRRPFLFTQSQAILARTWIPLQDSPGVRFTWSATIRVPADLMAVMSAANPKARNEDGSYSFEMPQAVPSYLMALAVGDLAFGELGPRSGVYAEPGLLEASLWEFADTEAMIAAAEDLYGPYRWERYDILVLPPSFPFGGMENPRLTFATPTILAGDRSLVALVAHELAHSWSGNLVTNATWEDFWLNEGFTVYFEHRIMEAVYGRDYSEMLSLLSLQGLEAEIAQMGADSADTHLRLVLGGRDPDDGMTAIAYDKGYFFLRMLEEAYGRAVWDDFVESYFDRHAFESMTTDGFLVELQQRLISQHPEVDPATLQIEAWVDGPGLPSNLPAVDSDAFEQVATEVERFTAGVAAGDLATDAWETQRTLRFLGLLPESLSVEQMADLDAAFGFTASGNSEILAAWLRLAVATDYRGSDAALEDFLTRQGRRKFLVPLYRELAKTPEGTERARQIYAVARPGYHPVATLTLDSTLNWE